MKKSALAFSALGLIGLVSYSLSLQLKAANDGGACGGGALEVYQDSDTI
ncbi:hypothetical protein O9992_23340 [Vibrio lentus]|nr:hypothetical protein [Vibrio lentus]